MGEDVLALALVLRDSGQPFALATVVRCERPTSAKPGAKALVRPDGSVSGWVGGACAEPVVVREALSALRDGQPRLIRLLGEGGASAPSAEGVVPYAMTCHSGGTLEIYVEPFMPKPLLVLIGHGPVVETLAALGRSADFAVETVATDAMGAALERLHLGPSASVVVATHGQGDEEALERVLAAGAGYVSLGASRKRAAAVVQTLMERQLTPRQLERLKAPAGLDIGATTPAEIAVSILAEVIRNRRSTAPPSAAIAEGQPPATAADARDPVCGMLVTIASARHRSDGPSGTVYFCCESCKAAFDREPRRFEALVRSGDAERR